MQARTESTTKMNLPQAPRRWHRHLAQLALAAACCGAGLATAAPVDDLRRQLEAGQAEQAWRTVLQNPQLAGDSEFDFLYGLAAINVGRIAEAVMALERHLSSRPGNERARLELARGYFLLGEYSRARAEFEFLLAGKPPAGVRASIDTFLQAMLLREGGTTQGSSRLYVEVGGGRDNNVSLGTYQAQMDSSTGVFTPTADARQISDDVAQLSAGAQGQYKVNARTVALAGVDLDQRGTRRFHQFDTTLGGAYVGFSYLTPVALWRVTLGSSHLRLGSKRFRDQLQLSGEANFAQGADVSGALFGQYVETRHAETDANRDGRITTLGGAGSRQFLETPWRPSLGVRATWIQDDNLRQQKLFSKKGPTLRLSASLEPMERLRLALNLNLQREDYGDIDRTFFDTVRRDDTVSVESSLTWAVDSYWSLRLEGSVLSTQSNIDLYDKRRKTLLLKLRYQL